MKLAIGKEQRVFDFISKIGKSKTALISHTDLDGITSARVVNQVVKPDFIKFIDYKDLNLELVEELNKASITKIIFTDLYIKDEKLIKALEQFAEVLILDHHLSPDWNSERTVCIRGEEGYSTGYLCYYLLSKIKDLEKIDWLVACSCVSDYCHVKPKTWLEGIYEKYGDTLEYKDDYVRQSGRIWDLQSTISLALIYFKKAGLKEAYNYIGNKFGDIGKLNKGSEVVRKEIDGAIKKFNVEKERISKGYFFDIDPDFSTNSIISSILSGKERNKLFVLIQRGDKNYRLSVRRQDGKLNCNEFVKKLVSGLNGADGGGHFYAAGGHFLKKDLPEVRKRLGLKSNQQTL